MIYQLKYGQNEEQIRKVCEISGQPLPKEIENKPILEENNAFYLSVFHELCTTRIPGFAEYPISINAIFEYCKHNEFSKFLTERVVFYSKKLDQAYLEYRSKEKKNG